MGGGNYSTKGRYSIRRQEQILEKPLRRTGKDFGIDLSYSYHGVKIINEKQWDQFKGRGVTENTLAFYDTRDNIIYIRRKEFAKLDKLTLLHETLHGQSGPNNYQTAIGQIIEEGTVQYITEYTLKNNFLTQAVRYTTARRGRVYPKEVQFVVQLMTIVGRKKFLQYWQYGFDKQATYYELERDLRSAGYYKTANNIDNYQTTFTDPNKNISKQEIMNTLNDEFSFFKRSTNFNLSEYWKIDEFEKE